MTGIEQNSIQQMLKRNLFIVCISFLVFISRFARVLRFFLSFEYSSKLNIQNPEPHSV